MLVIPMYQPYATAASLGLKRIETRPGRTHYRGLAAIHACSGWPATYREAYWSLPEYIRAQIGTTLPFGQIIAVVDLIACVPSEKFSLEKIHILLNDGTLTLEMTDQERCLGDYAPGRFGWVLENVRVLREPLTYKAHQGCYRLPADIAAEVERRAGGAR